MSEVNDIIISLEDVNNTGNQTEAGVDSGINRESEYPVAGRGLVNQLNINGKYENREKKSVSFDENTHPEPPSPTKAKDLPLENEHIMLAATLILDAKRGRNLEYITTERHVRLYNLYHKPYLRWILYLAIAMNMSLALFEKPSIPNASIPYWGTMIIEAFCVGYFSFRILHAISFQHSKVFFKDPKNIMACTVIVLTLFDMFAYILWINLAPDTHPIRWSRPLRPLLIINFPDGKQIRRAFRNIRRTIPDIMNTLILFFLCVFLFGLLALKLFYKRGLRYPNKDTYFANYIDSVWDLYVLVTTANNPDVMMPAYNENAWFALFFIIYLILCLYIFMSIVLATIYTNYKKNLKNEIRETVFLKRKRLFRAFEILKVERGGKSIITHSRWRQLMDYMMPTKSSSHIDLMMKILDDDNTNVLSLKNFMNLSDLLHVELTEVKDRKTWFEMLFPNVYNHVFSEKFKVIVRHRFFRFAFDFLIVVNAIFIALDIDEIDWFFLTVFTIEIVCKLYVYGGKEFFIRLWNVFDFFIIGAAFIASIVEKSMGKSDEELSTLDILLVLRVMRLIKIFGSIKRFKVILQTLVNIGPSILTYGGVMFIFYYFFAIIGMELFSGYIHYYENGYDETKLDKDLLFCGNKALNGTLFYRSHYCKNNFNDLVKAIVVMFELTVVNQWHVITSGFVLVTSVVARLYFFVFHLCCVVIILNIFTAFILEAFILEYSLQTVPKLESYVEAKIKELGLGIGMRPRSKTIDSPSGDKIDLVDDEVEPDTQDGNNGDPDSDDDSLPDLSKEKGLKFHLKKSKRKKVEVLLQQMFQGELSEYNEEGQDEPLDNYVRKRRATLDEVT